MRDIIRKLDDTNPGGVMLMQFAPVTSVQTWVAKAGGRYTGEVGFFEGWRWYSIYGTPETLSFREKKNRAAAGVFWEAEAACVVPGDDSEFRDLWEWADDRRFIVRTKDHVGDWRLVGTPWHGLRLEKVDFDTDRMMGGVRGFGIGFEGKTPSQSGIYPFV
jgi:hypothetical protein